MSFDYEEEFDKNKPKEQKKARKIASRTDRSKFKKTDAKKIRKPEIDKEGLNKGRVLAVLAEGILVDDHDQTITCTLKGSLKKEITRSKNLITVGDFVLFSPLGNTEGSIEYIEPRISVLSRAEHFERKKEQLIAANIDQVLIVQSVGSPTLKPHLLDRYIIAARKGNMDPIIVINKIDLNEEQELLDEITEIYTELRIPILQVSVKENKGIEELKEILHGKASVFSGQSGVGKSSLINAITGRTLRIGEIIEKTNKGTHTTTTAHLLPLDCGGFCIDTPGIRSFGMWDLKKEEVQSYFPEIATISIDCRYPNCTHTHEPECAVQKALEAKEISPLRFASYSALIKGSEHMR